MSRKNRRRANRSAPAGPMWSVALRPLHAEVHDPAPGEVFFYPDIFVAPLEEIVGLDNWDMPCCPYCRKAGPIDGPQVTQSLVCHSCGEPFTFVVGGFRGRSIYRCFRRGRYLQGERRIG
jgi:hypothetical protein